MEVQVLGIVQLLCVQTQDQVESTHIATTFNVQRTVIASQIIAI
jgi:hypothetical protein